MSSPRRTTLPLLLAAALALAMPRLADAQTPATNYRACTVSLRQVVTVGIPLVLLLAPKNGPWPPDVVFTPIATGLQGTFFPAAATGNGSALLQFVFIPSAPGVGTLTATNNMNMLEAPLAPVVLPGSKLDMPAVCSAAWHVLAQSILT